MPFAISISFSRASKLGTLHFAARFFFWLDHVRVASQQWHSAFSNKQLGLLAGCVLDPLALYLSSRLLWRFHLTPIRSHWWNALDRNEQWSSACWSKRLIRLLARSYFRPLGSWLFFSSFWRFVLSLNVFHWWNTMNREVKQVKRSNLALWHEHLARVDFEDRSWEWQTMLTCMCLWKKLARENPLPHSLYVLAYVPM